ncbi:MAG: hypothetical protein AB7E60_04080 [Sphingobium sp.]
MSGAARSLFVFGCYMLAVGMAMLFAPNLILSVVGLPPDHGVWIHLVGLLALYIGIYDLAAARQEARLTIRLSVPMRGAVPFVFAAFILAGLSDWPLMLFGAIDLIGAGWTWAELRRERAGAAR